MDKSCYYCQTDKPVKAWIEENHWEGENGRGLKEVYIGYGNFGAKVIMPEPSRKDKPINTIHYCSMKCLNGQMNKEDRELWEKGNCKECKKLIAVINDECQDLEHKKLGALFPIKTPECLKK